MREGRTCVYRAYINDELAYVGMTRAPHSRFTKHKYQKPWWRSVTRIDIIWYQTRDEARIAEIKAISLENPTQNLFRPINWWL